MLGGMMLGKFLNLGSDAAGKAISDKLDHNRKSRWWKFMQNQGATIPEIMGSGSGGAGIGTQPPVLGNGPEAATLAKAEYDKQEREKDRKSAERIAAIQAGETRHSTDTQARTATLARNQVDAKIRAETERTQADTQRTRADTKRIDAETNRLNAAYEKLLQDKRFEAMLFDERWSKIAAQMGMDNVLTAAMGAAMDMDWEAMLQNMNLDGRDRKKALEFARRAYAMKSTFNRELKGVSQSVSDATYTLLEALAGEDSPTLQGDEKKNEQKRQVHHLVKRFAKPDFTKRTKHTPGQPRPAGARPPLVQPK